MTFSKSTACPSAIGQSRAQPKQETLVHRRQLRLLEKEYLIKGRRHGKKFRLGDNVRVKVARINAFRSEIDFELIERYQVS